MRTITYLYLTLSIAFSGSACQKASDIVPEKTVINKEGFIRGQIKEPEQTTFSQFEIEIGRQAADNLELNAFWQSDVSEGALGSTLIVGAYPLFYNVGTPLFGLQFWGGDLPANRNWTAEELDTFFTPGSTFEFGLGHGKVDLMLLLPLGPGSSPEPSRSSFLEAPLGSLTITAIEDLDYPVYGRTSERRYGKLIHCTFSGQIGRYDSYADQMDGDPSFFQTDEIVELENGEAVFYVNYDER